MLNNTCPVKFALLTEHRKSLSAGKTHGAIVGKGHRNILDRSTAFPMRLNIHTNLDLDIESLQTHRYYHHPSCTS